MSKRESLSRYNLIINRIRKSNSSLKEIKDYLSRESNFKGDNFNVSKRTIGRDLDDIRSLYDIDIQYDFRRKVYYIESEGKPDINARMLETFDILNALNISSGISQFIHLEKRRPLGTENLHGLIHAIKNKLIIRFSHQKFWEDDPTVRTVEPYALKESRNRWYLIAKDYKDLKIKSFALDRLSNLEFPRGKFEYPKDYNVEENYRYSFGIIESNGQEPQEIILSFEPEQGKYIKTLPLHVSQQVIMDTEDELQVKLKLWVTHDLIMELLSYGNSMKVLKPKSLANRVKSEHEKAFLQY